METPWRTRQSPPRALLVVAGGVAIVTVISIAVLDTPIARAIASYQASGLWDSAITVLEWALLLPVHKLALPILLVIGMLATVIVKRWRHAAPAWMVVAGVHLISRLTTNWIKDGTGRFRPTEWLKHHADATFGWEGGVSFPSGHVVLFASVLVPLVIVMPPRWRAVLVVATIVIVSFVGAARMAVGAHFLSDVTGAIALVAAWTWLVGSAVRTARRATSTAL